MTEQKAITAGETVPGRVYVHPEFGRFYRVEFDGFERLYTVRMVDVSGAVREVDCNRTGFLEVLTNTGENAKQGEGE